MDNTIRIACVGDLILDEPGPMEPYFEGSRQTLQTQDVLIGHVETPHTTRNLPSCIDIQAPPSNPEHLDVLADIGFDIATVAGNHLYDCGPYGVTDTVDRLKSLGIQPVGGGANITEAKKPAIVEKDGLKIGVLSYNATGPKLGWAMSQKPGANYVPVETSYIAARDMPGCPAKTYTFIWPQNIKQLQDEVAALRAKVDILAVVFHKGNGGDHPRLDNYEQPLCYAALDAGADMIFAHHHHVLKGVELYKGKPIYHGLGNFVCVTYAMTAGYNDTPEMIAYLKQRAKEGRGDGHYEVPFYPWSDVSRYTMIAQVTAGKNGVTECGLIPCYIEKSGNITVRTRDNGGQDILDFIIRQTDGASLNAAFEWNEDGTFVRMREKQTRN
ncbi:MAG: CapA family protein [Clostridiales bacterium]|nr:CapA family protein [Clostridiales bacterium]